MDFHDPQDEKDLLAHEEQKRQKGHGDEVACCRFDVTDHGCARGYEGGREEEEQGKGHDTF